MALLQTSTMLATVLSVLSCIQLPLAIAGPVARRSDLAVKDYHPAPRAWSNLGQAPSDHVIHLTIGLSQSRFSELERHLYEGKVYPQMPIPLSNKLTGHDSL